FDDSVVAAIYHDAQIDERCQLTAPLTGEANGERAYLAGQAHRAQHVRRRAAHRKADDNVAFGEEGPQLPGEDAVVANVVGPGAQQGEIIGKREGAYGPSRRVSPVAQRALDQIGRDVRG